MTDASENNLVNLEEACTILSISTATGRNWIKSGKLKPVNVSKGRNRKYLFAKEEIDNLLNDIKGGQDSKLKSRRNKKHVKGFFIPKNYVDDKSGFESVFRLVALLETLTLPENFERVLLAEYALKFLSSEKLIEARTENYLAKSYIENKAIAGRYTPLIEDLLSGVSDFNRVIEQLTPALSLTIPFLHGQDMLGLLFMSLKCMGERKSNGIYYTPIKIVRDTLDSLETNGRLKSGQTILDPCCGTGNFLIYTYLKTNRLEELYGWDTDPLAITITRINMALVSRTCSIDTLYQNFICADTLMQQQTDQAFSLIVGNPPWGYDFSGEDETLLRNNFLTAQSKSIESFSVFLESAINSVQVGGCVSFVLPESILNVRIHQAIRDFIFNHGTVRRVRYWGNIFAGVHCPAITLTFYKSPGSFTTKDTEVITEARSFIIRNSRKLDRSNWNYNITDQELKILHKLDYEAEVVNLKNNADFALGIVTGNNAKMISAVQTPQSELILKGSDIYKYKFRTSGNYLVFEPQSFQQVAPVAMYRAQEKLIYRFICNALVFAYDPQQTLSLNSANIVIPRLEGFSIKYILAVLNSRTIQYYFKHKFNSVKILRSHIEALPIPLVSQQLQEQIAAKVDLLLSGNSQEETLHYFNEIEDMIMTAFNLSEPERNEIFSQTELYNLFL